MTWMRHCRRRIASGALDYNYFRNYEPGTGRYEESDPIRLAGGLDEYAYAGLNPMRYRDPFGTTQQDIQ